MFPSGTVTFLFTDIEGSTPLWEIMPDEMRVSLTKHNDILRKSIDDNKGQVFNTAGDEVQAVFSFPVDALRAAINAQRALSTSNWGRTGPLRVRMGIHTGPANSIGNDYESSHTLNRASRIMSIGAGGQILLSFESAEILRRELPEGISLLDRGEYRLKGMKYYERLYQVIAPELARDFPELELKSIRPNNLPQQLTSFIGREEDVGVITKKMRDPDIHLLTLTGIGGVGKTRLSLQVGHQLLNAFPNGVFFVSLVGIRDEHLVLPTIAETFGLEETAESDSLELLKNHLSSRKMLIILDNFEQVLPAAQKIVTLLNVAPHLKVLVTSRSLLGLSFEHSYIVAPLNFPESNELNVDNITEYDAMQLFIDRARFAEPDFQADPHNILTLGEICRQLDGIPLALELAAAQTRVLSVQEIKIALNNRFRLLVGGPGDLPDRHQTMLATIDWSYQMLTGEEQTIFRQFSIFAGGCTLEALKYVCDLDSAFILQILKSLVHKNLIRHINEDGNSRYLMYETIREYGLKELEKSGDSSPIYRKYALYYISLANQNAQTPRALDREIDNIRAILQWSIDTNNSQLGFRLTGDNFFWSNRVSEGRRWIDELLALPSKSHQIHRRGYSIFVAIILANYQGDLVDAQERIVELSNLATRTENRILQHMAEFGEGYLKIIQEHYSEAESIFTKIINSLRLPREWPNAVWSNSMLSATLLQQGKIENAVKAIEECLTISSKYNNQLGIADGYTYLGFVAIKNGDTAQAKNWLQEGLRLSNRIGTRGHATYCLSGLACVAIILGEYIRAARIFGAATSIAQITGVHFEYGLPVLAKISAEMLNDLRTQLEEDVFSYAFEEGKRMSLDEVISYSLSDE
jgi:predicted ATPase/class 3 adenylate cyclase